MRQFLQQYKSDFKANIILAYPIILGQLGQIFVNIVDNLMVGRLGAAPLAAVSLANALFFSYLVVGLGISFALPPLIAEADATNNEQRISQLTKHSLIVNLSFALFANLFIEIMIPFLHYLKQEPEVLELCIPYLRISAWSIIPLMIFQTLRCNTEGRSKTLPPMIATLSANVVNVILNYLLIFGNLGFPKLGVSGAAWGTLIARIFMLFLLIYILQYWKSVWRPIRNMNLRKYQNRLFKQILKLGIPTSLQGFFEVSAFAGASILAGTIHKEAQAAHQIAINLASISFLMCTGIAMAATIRVGNQYGANNREKLRNVGISAMLQVAFFMFLTSILYISLRKFLPTLYIDNQEVIDIAAGLLIMASIFQIPDGVQVTAIGALRGMQDVMIPTLYTFIAYWVMALPVGALLAFYFNLGALGIWIGLTVGLSISASLMAIRFLRKTG